MNLATVIEDHDADRPALHSRGEVITYGELRDRVAQARGALVARGIEPGDRVAVVSGNNWYFVVAYLATLGVGAVAVPLNPLSPAPELTRELAAVGARLALAGPIAEDAVAALVTEDIPDFEGIVPVADLLGGDPAPLVERKDDDLAVLLFTSGTAGRPRPAMLTHGNLLANIGQILANPARPAPGDDVSLGVLPLFHVFGLNALLGQALAVGSSVVLVERFDPHTTLQAIVTQLVHHLQALLIRQRAFCR